MFRLMLKVEVFVFLVCGELIVAIIHGFKTKMPLREAAGHVLILLESVSKERTV